MRWRQSGRSRGAMLLISSASNCEKMKTQKRGFTLTELLITIAVIAILAAIALPKYLQGEAARVSEAISQLSSIRLGEEGYKTGNGLYLTIAHGCTVGTPPCWDTIGIDSPEANTQRFFNYQVLATPTTFCAVATRNANANPPAGFPNTTVCQDNSGAYFGTNPKGPNPNPPPAGNVCVGPC